MKISLVVPDFLSGTSFLQQPLDLLYASTMLTKNGFETEIIDCRVNHLSLSNLVLKLNNTDLAIITTTPCDQVQNYFLDYRYSYAINTINYVKNQLPKLPVAVCGAHVSVRPDLVLKEVYCDFYIKGEIILTCVKLALAVANKAGIDDVPNMIRRVGDMIVDNYYDADYYHPFLPDDVLPDYAKVPMQLYFGVKYINNIPIRRQKRAVIQSGRGCPFNCTFCHNYYGKQIRRRSAEVVALELSICQNVYGIEEIFVLDEVFTLDKKWLIQLENEMDRRGINLELTIQTRVDCIDEEILAVLCKMGVKNIWLGVESANDKILSASKKGIEIAMINNAIEKIRKTNIIPNAFFMLGMPGETVDTLNSTIEEIYKSKIPYTRSVMICTPRYNTPLYDMARQQYPFVEDHWFNLNAVRGLVNNDMTPAILQRAKSIFKNREFLYLDKAPKI